MIWGKTNAVQFAVNIAFPVRLSQVWLIFSSRFWPTHSFIVAGKSSNPSSSALQSRFTDIRLANLSFFIFKNRCQIRTKKTLIITKIRIINCKDRFRLYNHEYTIMRYICMITSEHLCCSYYVLNQVINLRRDLRVRISITDSKLWLVPFTNMRLWGRIQSFINFYLSC